MIGPGRIEKAALATSCMGALLLTALYSGCAADATPPKKVISTQLTGTGGNGVAGEGSVASPGPNSVAMSCAPGDEQCPHPVVVCNAPVCRGLLTVAQVCSEAPGGADGRIPNPATDCPSTKACGSACDPCAGVDGDCAMPSGTYVCDVVQQCVRVQG